MTTADDTVAGMLDALDASERRLRVEHTEAVKRVQAIEGELARVAVARAAITGAPIPSPRASAPYRRVSRGHPASSGWKTEQGRARRDLVTQWAATQPVGAWWVTRDAADALDMSPQSLAPTLGRMVANGYLERTDLAAGPPRFRLPVAP